MSRMPGVAGVQTIIPCGVLGEGAKTLLAAWDSCEQDDMGTG